MRFLSRNSLIGQCFALLILLALSMPAHAQGVAAHSGDASVNAGINNVSIAQDKTHAEFGFSGGYNFIPQLALSGEFSYLPQGSGIPNLNIQLYGVNLRYSPWVAPFKTTRVVPYAVISEGYAHYGSNSGSFDGSYFGLGVGTSFYLTPNVGIRPEFRWEDLQYIPHNQSSYNNSAHLTIAVFYQWGGTK